jgi:hypothetical protein
MDGGTDPVVSDPVPADLDRALALARRGLLFKSVALATGFGCGAALATVAAARFAGATSLLDAALAAVCAGAAVWFLVFKPANLRRAARGLDRAMGIEAFSAARECAGELRGLSARAAVELLGGRNPAKLTSAGFLLFLAGPAIGAGALLLSPDPRRAIEMPAAESPAVALVTMATAMQRNAASPEEAARAEEIAILGARVRSGGPATDEAIELLQDKVLQLAPSAAAREKAGAALARTPREARLEELVSLMQQFAQVGGGSAGAGETAPGADRDGATGGGGGREAPGTAPSSAGPSGTGEARGRIAGASWAAKYDDVVRRYFELDPSHPMVDGLASAPAQSRTDGVESRPAPRIDHR